MLSLMKIELPDNMDIPEIRRNTNDSSNRQWLLRNLVARNKNHPEFARVMKELSEIENDFRWFDAFVESK